MRDKWWDGLSPQMQQYLESQPLWHDRDLYTALAAGLIMGFVFGYLTRI